MQFEPQLPAAEIRASLDWFLEVAPDRAGLEQRIRRAQQHCQACAGDGVEWPAAARLLLRDDRIAGCLAQGFAAVGDRRGYDDTLGGLILPFLASIGGQVELLRRRPGATERVRRMLHATLEHPGTGLHELATAARYIREDFEVAFIADGQARGADLAIRITEIPRAMQLACRALPRGRAALREQARIQRQFARLAPLIHARALSLDIDVRFHVALAQVPRAYLAERISAAASGSSPLQHEHRWRDEYAEGSVRAVALDRVLAGIRNGRTGFGSPLARALSERAVPEDGFAIALRAKAAADQPRRIADLDYASVLTWHCLAPESRYGTARQLRAELPAIDRRLAGAEVGVVHIALPGESDPVTADQHRRENLAAVRAFTPRSRIAELHLHYFQPHAAEAVDRHSRWHGFLLEDARLLG